MMNYSLPYTLSVDGNEYPIRTDFRATLDAIAALNDPELLPFEAAEACIRIFFPDWREINDRVEAFRQCMWFIACGKENDDKPHEKLMDWEQDLPLIIAPVNRILGFDCRGKQELHWWTFVAAYYEIGECAFSTVTSIRQKQKKGKKLDDWEREYLSNNADIVLLKDKFSAAEQAEINEILGVSE